VKLIDCSINIKKGFKEKNLEKEALRKKGFEEKELQTTAFFFLI
jgi:hypothetical protein